MSRLKGFISQLFAAPDRSSASSDDALLARYREGDGAAFEILYAAIARVCIGFCSA